MAEKEQRYIVLEGKDVREYLTDFERRDLVEICRAIQAGRRDANKPQLECVVVEADWPMYNETWEKVLKYAEEQENAVQKSRKR